jgi:hypothetical protein
VAELSTAPPLEMTVIYPIGFLPVAARDRTRQQIFTSDSWGTSDLIFANLGSLQACTLHWSTVNTVEIFNSAQSAHIVDYSTPGPKKIYQYPLIQLTSSLFSLQFHVFSVQLPLS